MKRITPEQLEYFWIYGGLREPSWEDVKDYIAALESTIDQLIWVKSLDGKLEYCRHCRVLRGKAHGVSCPAGIIMGE